MLVLAVVTSPVSWSHYYLLLLLPWALYLGGRLGLPDDAATRWLMAGGMLLASLPVVVLPLGSGIVAAIVSRTIVSAWMFGGLLDAGSTDPRRVVCWPIERRGKAAGERALVTRQGRT